VHALDRGDGVARASISITDNLSFAPALFASKFNAATNHLAVIIEVSKTPRLAVRDSFHRIRVDCALADAEVEQ